MTERRRVVRVPATSANLGPGYDVMAAALALEFELEVIESGRFEVTCENGINVSRGRDNLVVRAFERLHPADGISFRIGGDIPLSRGLGSSAAAIVAGLVAADHLFELGNDRGDLLRLAAEIEGHPDNVAAALYGGFVIAGHGFGIGDENGTDEEIGAVRFDPPSDLEALLVIPSESVSTDGARSSIPDLLPTCDAVANIGSTALLVLGLREGDLGMVRRGLRDAIHQPRRRELYPRSMDIIDRAVEVGAIGATISGAGPTVMVWTSWQETGRVSGQLAKETADWAELRRVPFSPHGARVPEL